MKRILLTLAIMASISSTYAITPKILFYGYVEQGNIETLIAKNETSPRLSQVEVTVNHGNEEVRAVKNRKTGFYSLILDVGKTYQVKFEKEGFITKIFEIDGSNIPEGNYDEAFKMFTDIKLFPITNAEDEQTLWSRPVAKCSFQAKTKSLVWDKEYAQVAFDNSLQIAAIKNDLTVK